MLTAAAFIKKLKTYQSDVEREKFQRFFKDSEGDVFLGVRMGQLFALAKEFVDLPPGEIEKLLESPIHEVRAGACSIMDKQARLRKMTVERRKELFDLYLRRTDRINQWDLVDLAAPHIVGRYLVDKPRKVLYKLARSKNPWERRTAIVATAYFIREGEVDDTFAIAEVLANDEHDLIQKAMGGWVREAGKRDRARLLQFLDEHAATMPRVALRYAMEHLAAKQRAHYMGMRPSPQPSPRKRGEGEKATRSRSRPRNTTSSSRRARTTE